MVMTGEWFMALFYPHYPKWMVFFMENPIYKWDEISGGSPITEGFGYV